MRSMDRKLELFCTAPWQITLLIQNYVGTIKALMANVSHRQDLRARAARAARECFSDMTVMCRLEHRLVDTRVGWCSRTVGRAVSTVASVSVGSGTADV